MDFHSHLSYSTYITIFPVTVSMYPTIFIYWLLFSIFILPFLQVGSRQVTIHVPTVYKHQVIQFIKFKKQIILEFSMDGIPLKLQRGTTNWDYRMGTSLDATSRGSLDGNKHLPPKQKAWWKRSILQVLQTCKKSQRALISIGSSFHQVRARYNMI